MNYVEGPQHIFMFGNSPWQYDIPRRQWQFNWFVTVSSHPNGLNMCKVDNSYTISFLIGHLYIIWVVCGSAPRTNTQNTCILKKDWIACWKYDNHLGSIVNIIEGNYMTIYWTRESSLSIMNEIFIWAPKSMRKMVTTSILKLLTISH